MINENSTAQEVRYWLDNEATEIERKMFLALLKKDPEAVKAIEAELAIPTCPTCRGRHPEICSACRGTGIDPSK